MLIAIFPHLGSCPSGSRAVPKPAAKEVHSAKYKWGQFHEFGSVISPDIAHWITSVLVEDLKQWFLDVVLDRSVSFECSATRFVSGH